MYESHLPASCNAQMSTLGNQRYPLDTSLHHVCACRLLLERRMRIVTVAMPVASAPAEVYAEANVDALLAVLVHKIGRVVMQQGVEQGQGLLQDWLVLFIAAYNNHRGLEPRSPHEVGLQLHLAMQNVHQSSCANLAGLP